MAFRNCCCFVCLQAGQPVIRIVMRDVQTRALILIPSLQPSCAKCLTRLFTHQIFRDGLARQPLRCSAFGICQPFETIGGELIKFNGNRAGGVHLSWQMQRLGLLTVAAKLVAQGETIAAVTAAGTRAAFGLTRFGHFNGTVKRNGSVLGNLVSAVITYSNNLHRIETIRGDGRIDGADPTKAAL